MMSRRIQAWPLLIFLIGSLTLTGCQTSSEQADLFYESGEITNQEKDDILDRMIPPREDLSLRHDQPIEPFEMRRTESFHRFQVESGRYHITGDGGGTVSIIDETDQLLFHETFHSYQPYGTLAAAVTLASSDTIHFNGLDNIYITPVETEPINELHSGTWNVGLDILPGNYEVHLNHIGFAFIEQYSNSGQVSVFNVNHVNELSSSAKLELAEGDILRITGATNIEFIER